MKRFLQKAFILPIIIALAVGLVVLKVKTKPSIEHEVRTFPRKTVEVITAKNIPFSPRAIAYGHVEPAVLLKSKAEVSGKIVYIHPELKKGGSIAKDTVVLRIEPTTFEFSLNESKAGLVGSQSSLKQLQTEEKSTQRSLKIAQKNLAVGEKELQRLKKVWDKRLISRSTLDAEEQKVLQLRQQVEDLQGKLASYSSRKSATQAQITQSKTQLAKSQDTLGRTDIKMPFDARIGAVFIEKGEFTAIGNTLFEASGTDAVEINAQLATRQFRPLLMGLGEHIFNLQQPDSLQAAVAQLHLQARISLVRYEDNTALWEGALLRIGESIDPTRDTISLVVAVDKPYEGVIPGKRPPLLKGMYAAVEFIAPAKEALVLPRKAIHQGRVYIAKANNQLEIRKVTIRYKQGELVVLDHGVKAGEKVIIGDVIPVIEGLPLKVIQAHQYEKQLAAMALDAKPTTASSILNDKPLAPISDTIQQGGK
jgi:multidrug efflux pump subunit AcrA (membrane-fusion protein)